MGNRWSALSAACKDGDIEEVEKHTIISCM